MSEITSTYKSKRTKQYALKTTVFLVLLILFSYTAAYIPPFFVGLIWAVASTAIAIGYSYIFITKKAHRQLALKEGGYLARLNNGRSLGYIASFIVAAILMASLAIDAPKWTAIQWALVVFVALVFPLVIQTVGKALDKEYEPFVKTANSVKWCGVITGLVMCLVYAVIIALLPRESFESFEAAFLSIGRPFNDSNSAILEVVGAISSDVDALTAYSIGEAGKQYGWLAVILSVILSASAFFGVTSLLGLCSLEFEELRKVFQPLDAKEEKTERYTITLKKPVIMAIILPMCLTAAFLMADNWVDKTIPVIADIERSIVPIEDDYAIGKSIGRDAAEFRGKSREEVIEDLVRWGFSRANIEEMPSNDLNVFTKLVFHENCVKSISINDNDNFRKDTVFPRGSKIVIVYYSFPD